MNPQSAIPQALTGARNPQSFMDGRRFRIALWAGLVALKLAYVLAVMHAPESDEILYVHLARGLAEGRGYLDRQGLPTAVVMPGMPVWLALGLLAGGGKLAAAYVMQALGSLVIALAGGRLAELFTGSRKMGLVAAVTIFILPPYFYYAGTLLTEIPYTAFFMLSLASWEQLRRQPERLRFWGLTGLFHVLAFMTRPVSFLLTPVIMGWPVVADGWRTKRLRWRVLGGFCLGSAVIVGLWAPWVIHNYRVYHVCMPLSYNSSNAFFVGTLKDYTKWDEEINKATRESGLFKEPKSQAELTPEERRALNAYISKRAWENIRRDPLGYVGRAAGNSWRFWLAEYPAYYYKGRLREYLKSGQWFAAAGKGGLMALNFALVGGMLWALWVLRRKWTYWPYMLLLLYFHAIHAIIIPIARYSVPLHGLVVVLIVAAVAERRRGRGPQEES